MKVQAILPLIFLISLNAAQSQPSGTAQPVYNLPPGMPVIIFHVHTAATASNTPVTEVKTDVASAQESKSDQGSQNSQQAAHTSTLTVPNPPLPTQKPSFFKKLGLRHYAGITVGIVACAYLARTVVVRQTTHVVKRKKSWCNWRGQQTATELAYQEDQKELSQQLLDDIKKRYTHPNYPHDQMHTITRFLTALQSETKVLQRYATTRRWEQKVHLDKIFSDKDLNVIVNERLEKLAYLKTLFLDWMRRSPLARNVAQ